MSASPWCLLPPFLSKPLFPLLPPTALGFGVVKLPQLCVPLRLPFAMPPRYNDAVDQAAVASVVTSEDERYGKEAGHQPYSPVIRLCPCQRPRTEGSAFFPISLLRSFHVRF
ncbi:hypothetical protein HPP92_005028 [Vanilla planifolia]|uniref:Uncharacterized protein n=1 Tax=Vanilla planifolia TaxID=51239 RepID=A0A835VAY6_VANPL|nr:hypothetical protein HPP92_005028 [Vanilla planifolia]